MELRVTAVSSPSTYVCRQCSAQIKTNSYKIQCVVCRYWFHRDCVNLSIADIQHYLKEKTDGKKWCCSNCQIVNNSKTEDLSKSTQTDMTQDSILQENQHLKRLIRELEEKNQLLKENKQLLEEKVKDLEKRMNDKKMNPKPIQTPRTKTPALSQPTEMETQPGTSNPTYSQIAKKVSNTSHVSEINQQPIKKIQPNRPRRRQVNVGTASINASESAESFVGKNAKKDKKAWLFVSRVKDHVTEDKIKSYIRNKLKIGDEDVIVKKFPTKYDNTRKDCKCFQVGVKFDCKDQVYDNDFWPTGVAYRRFKFNFQDNDAKDFPETETRGEI